VTAVEASLILLGALLLQECPERLCLLLPSPLPAIVRSPDWKAETVRRQATDVVAAALVRARFTSQTELAKAVQTLEPAATLTAYRAHRARLAQAELRSMALVRKELERALGCDAHAQRVLKVVA
jgi:hypothetical protein